MGFNGMDNLDFSCCLNYFCLRDFNVLYAENIFECQNVFPRASFIVMSRGVNISAA